MDKIKHNYVFELSLSFPWCVKRESLLKTRDLRLNDFEDDDMTRCMSHLRRLESN